MRRGGIICDKATSKKYMFRKNLNSLYRVRGRKLQGVYLALDTTFGGKRVGCLWPTKTVRVEDGSCSSSGSSSTDVSSSKDGRREPDPNVGSRSVDPSLESVFSERAYGLRPYDGARRGSPSSSSRPSPRSSSSLSVRICRLPALRFLNGILAAKSRTAWSLEDRGE